MEQLDFWPELLEEARNQAYKKMEDLRFQWMLKQLDLAREELDKERKNELKNF